MSNREAEYKQDWIKQHDKADEIVVDTENKNLVAAIYYYPPEQHMADQKKIWRAIALRMELEKLELMDEDNAS